MLVNEDDPFSKTCANLLIQNSKYLEREELDLMLGNLKNQKFVKI